MIANTDPFLDQGLSWGEPLRLRTSRGEYEVRRAPATAGAREAWRMRAKDLANLGYSMVLERKDGAVTCYHWTLAGRSDADALAEVHALSHASKSTFDVPSPAGLHFYEYQKAGISFAWAVKNALIGDEMGLGKTLQAIGIANLMAAREGMRSMLVVTLAGLKINWRREMTRWLTYDAEVVIADGGPPDRIDRLFGTTGPRVLVINYDLLPRWGALLLAQPWDLYVADEAHYMKNAKTGRAKVGLKINAARKLFLTGTPMNNRPAELWPLLHALQPAKYREFFPFGKRFCDAKQKRVPFFDKKKNKKVEGGILIWDFSGASNLEELNTDIRSHVMVRRLKKDVLPELPRKQRQVIELPADCAEMDNELGLFINQERKLAALRVAVERAKLGDDLDAYKAAVRALAKGVSASFTNIARQRKETALAKVSVGILHLKELLAAGEKVICFAHHHEVIDRVKAAFPEESVVIHGEMNGPARQVSVDRFQNDETVRLCIAGIRSGGTGHNLTAATVVVFLELDWVPAVMAQAEDRAHRIGQTRSVLVQLLVLEGSLDARMAEIICSKLAIADQALDGMIPDAEPLCPWTIRGAGEDAAPEKLATEGALISDERKFAISRGLKYLAALCDHGRSTDQAGFNTVDAAIGHELAAVTRLSAKQAAMGLRLMKRYHRQVPEDLLAACLETHPAGTIPMVVPAQGVFAFPSPETLRVSA